MDERRVGMETHGSDPSSGRSSRNGTAGLPQSVPEHYERSSERDSRKFSEGEMELGEVEVGGRKRGEDCEWTGGEEERSFRDCEGGFFRWFCRSELRIIGQGVDSLFK